MKKAKNDAVTDNGVKLEENKQKNKAAVNSRNIPSEKIRGKDKEERELLFKKVLYGYDPDEVSAYIDELNETYETSSRIHESKLSSLKEELVLSNRERDAYIEKYRALSVQAESTVLPQTEEQVYRTAESESIISDLKKKVEQAELENERLRQLFASDKNEIISSYAQKISELEARNRELETDMDSLCCEQSRYESTVHNYEKLTDEYNCVFAELEQTKSELDSCKKQLESKLVELNEKVQQLNTVSSEYENIKKQAAELEVKNSVLEKRLEESGVETAQLKEINKNQSLEFAEKLSVTENGFARRNLALQKQLKLHGCYVEQAQLTITELSKQMEQIRQSLEITQEV